MNLEHFLFVFVDRIEASERSDKLDALERLLGKLVYPPFNEHRRADVFHHAGRVSVGNFRQRADVEVICQNSAVFRDQSSPQHWKKLVQNFRKHEFATN